MAISVNDQMMWRHIEQKVKTKKSEYIYMESTGSRDFASKGKHLQKQLKTTI